MLLFGPRFKSARLHKVYILNFFLFLFHIISSSSRDKSLILVLIFFNSLSIVLNLLENLSIDFFNELSALIFKCLLKLINENNTSPNSSSIPFLLEIASFNSLISSSTLNKTCSFFSQSKPTPDAYSCILLALVKAGKAIGTPSKILSLFFSFCLDNSQLPSLYLGSSLS